MAHGFGESRRGVFGPADVLEDKPPGEGRPEARRRPARLGQGFRGRGTAAHPEQTPGDVLPACAFAREARREPLQHRIRGRIPRFDQCGTEQEGRLGPLGGGLRGGRQGRDRAGAIAERAGRTAGEHQGRRMPRAALQRCPGESAGLAGAAATQRRDGGQFVQRGIPGIRGEFRRAKGCGLVVPSPVQGFDDGRHGIATGSLRGYAGPGHGRGAGKARTSPE